MVTTAHILMNFLGNPTFPKDFSPRTATVHVCIRVNIWIFPGLTVIDQDMERDFLLLELLDKLLDGLQRRQIAIQKLHCKRTETPDYLLTYHGSYDGF